MPTYEYRCASCGHTFEKFQSIKAEPVEICPKCSKKQVKRMINGGSGLIFKGSGFYLTDYKNKSLSPSTPRPESKKGDDTKKD